ncbi:MAG TPA: hypothetical protein VEO56_10150 [Bacteroidota bacterium]|nr:hypothetical protein [Bacteroidota bacterium]
MKVCSLAYTGAAVRQRLPRQATTGHKVEVAWGIVNTEDDTGGAVGRDQGSRPELNGRDAGIIRISSGKSREAQSRSEGGKLPASI